MNKEEIIHSLENKGFCIIENYYTAEKCDEIFKEVYNMFPKNFEHQTQEGRGGDYRMPFGENFFNNSKKFLNESNLLEIAESYTGKIIKKRCQIGVVEHRENSNFCSGGGWHVDNHNKQFKAILYLTDVNENNGYFSIVESSRNTIKNIGTHPAYKGDNSQTRISDENINQKNTNKIHNILGSKGTLILVDTSNIHRGNIIKEGNRLTYTNYYLN
jgi:hypothetical protein